MAGACVKGRLIIADDHQVVRQGLRNLFSRTADLRIVAETGDGLEAEHLARTLMADLLILDVAMPARRGVQILESLRADGVMLPVLFFSMYPPDQYVDYVRRAGAQGFVGKEADTSDLLRAVRQIRSGGTCFPGRQRDRERISGEDLFGRLSRRESDVLRGLVAGASLIDIAVNLGLNPRTVTTYRRRLLEKLGVTSNAELVVLAMRQGLI
jgi:two-component system, NarL family, invasion response regulator UvrY